MRIHLGLFVVAALALAGTAPSAWAASDQAQTPAKQRHVRQSQTRPPSTPAVPQNSCDYDRAAGRCVIDLGNGRCTECSNGPR